MVYTSSYKPAYYTTLQDSITSICKSILPFKRRPRLTAIAEAEKRLSEQQSDNLKWQQDSFHQILKLMGLCKEGILAETEVSAYRSFLLDTLVASPHDHEQELILRDKIVFLQELLYAKCISDEEYHLSKRPLLERLALQGAEIGVKDIIVAAPKETSEEGWSVIELKDEDCLLNKNSNSKTKLPLKQIKGGKSFLGFGSSSQKYEKNKEEKGPSDQRQKPLTSTRNESSISRENPFWESENSNSTILMSESLPTLVENQIEGEKVKKKFWSPFKREHNKEGNEDCTKRSEEKIVLSEKKQWGFDGLKKSKRNDFENEIAPLPLSEKSDNEVYLGFNELVARPIGEGPDIKQIKKKLHSNGSPSDFFIDKVLEEKVKKELSRIQVDLNAKNPNFKFTDDQIEIISIRLPIDKADLKNFFPKSWCDRYGEIVLDIVRREFKDHVGEMEGSKNAAREKKFNSKRWETFDDDDENCHPNLFATREKNSFPEKQAYNPMCNSFKNNPFSPEYVEADYKPRTESASIKDQNPFWAY